MAMHEYGTTVSDFTEGERVATHPATDHFMRGKRYGTVRKLGMKYVHVHLDSDAENKLTGFNPWSIRKVESQ